MAKQVEIVVEIDEQGQLQVHVKGRKGKGCIEILDIFAQSVGQVTDRRLTEEYYEQEQAAGLATQRASRRSKE